MEVKIVSHKEYRLHPITAPIPLGWTWAEWVCGFREMTKTLTVRQKNLRAGEAAQKLV